MNKPKIIGKSKLECEGCEHRKRSECHHPDQEHKRFKPFIIAEEGTRYPVFCTLPEAKKYRCSGP